MYKQALQRHNVNWIGLRLNPPLLLRMLEGKNEEEERKQWEETERKVGLYAQVEETTTEAWDAREATRAMKDMYIDWVAQRMSNTFSGGAGDDEPHDWVTIWTLIDLLSYSNHIFS